MASKAKVEVEVGLKTAKAARAFKSFQRGMIRSFRMLTGGALGIESLTYQIKRLTVGVVKLGFEFNSTMENAQLGIATMLKMMQPDKFADWNDALLKASELTKDLAKAGMDTTGSVKDLAQAFSILMGPMTKAGIPLERQVKLLVTLQNATALLAAGSGSPQLQLISEVRALLEGRMAASSVVGSTVFGSDKMKARLKAAIGTSDLADLLEESFKPFAESGKMMQKTFSGLMSNLRDVMDSVTGVATEEAFNETKKYILDIQKAISDPSFSKGLTKLTNFVTMIVKFGVELGTTGTSSLGEAGSLKHTLLTGMMPKFSVETGPSFKHPITSIAEWWWGGYTKFKSQQTKRAAMEEEEPPAPPKKFGMSLMPGVPLMSGFLQAMLSARAVLTKKPKYNMEGVNLGESAKKGLFAARGMGTFQRESMRINQNIMIGIQRLVRMAEGNGLKVQASEPAV